MTILAEGGNLRRFGHHRQFLKYCGLTSPRANPYPAGKEQLSKRGNGCRARHFAGCRSRAYAENCFARNTNATSAPHLMTLTSS
jgi:transposase